MRSGPRSRHSKDSLVPVGNRKCETMLRYTMHSGIFNGFWQLKRKLITNIFGQFSVCCERRSSSLELSNFSQPDEK